MLGNCFFTYDLFNFIDFLTSQKVLKRVPLLVKWRKFARLIDRTYHLSVRKL